MEARLWATLSLTTFGKPLRRAALPSHAAKRVHVELDRGSYSGHGRTKVMRRAFDSRAFPDSGAQVTLISPVLVKAMGGEGLVKRASLQIKDAGNHLMETTGAVFVVISQKDKVTGLVTKTQQMAYISSNVEDVVLSHEALESLKIVANLDDRKKAEVNLVNSTVKHPYYSKSLSPVVTEVPGVGGSSLRSSRQFESTPVSERRRSVEPMRSCASVHSTQRVSSALPTGGPEFREYTSDTVQGGQLTLDLIAAHNIDFPHDKVSLSDLKPSTDPEFKCKGTLPFKNGILTCGCFVRAEAPDPISHKDRQVLMACQRIV
jgi:hypothetical protein